MPLTYIIARIFTSEESRFKGKPLDQAIVEFIRRQCISARCHVTKGISGCYENGEIATQGIEVFSFNMPLEIIVIMPKVEGERLLPMIEEMVDEGIMTVEEKDVRWHKCRKQMIPRQLRVRDVMTANPQTLPLDASPFEAIRILLSGPFHGIPIVDAKQRPVGMVTHGDLLRHTGLPVNLRLFRHFDPSQQETMDKVLEKVPLAEIMSKPAVVIHEDQWLSQAVEVMFEQDVKRLPTIGKDGRITGILSRLDVFKTIMDRNPDWETFDRNGVKVQNLTRVEDAMRNDTPTLPPSAPIWDAIQLIDTTNINRVAVVDPQGKLLGLISDRILIAAFSAHKTGFLHLLVDKLSFKALAPRHAELLKVLGARMIGEIMLTDFISVKEGDLIDEALSLMVTKKLKRLPVLDDRGHLKGMLTRDSLLRAIQPPQPKES